MKKSKAKKKQGRIKRDLSGWNAFKEEMGDFIVEGTPWNVATPEVLHIAILLDKHQIGEIIDEFISLKDILKTQFKYEWNGTLSGLFWIVTQENALPIIRETKLDNALRHLINGYQHVFGVDEKIEILPETLYIIAKAYHDLSHRKNEKAILSKFILMVINMTFIDPERLLELRDKELILSNQGRISSLWPIAESQHGIINKEFSEQLWSYNIDYFNFIIDEDSTVAENAKINDSRIVLLQKITARYFDQFKAIPLLDYFNRYIAEVIMGFVGRINYLSTKIVEQEQRHEGEIAEMTLRVLYETQVKFLWLFKKQDTEALQNYRNYMVGREKHMLDVFKGRFHDNKPHTERVFNELQSDLEKIAKQEGVDEFAINTERGDAFEKNLNKLAEDLDDQQVKMYDLIYKRTSDIIHSNWRCLYRYHLERSLNPTHSNLLRYSSSSNTFAGLLPSFIGLIISVRALLSFFEYYAPLKADYRALYRKLFLFHETLLQKYLNMFSPELTEGSKLPE